MQVNIKIINAFVTEEGGGNAAAVVLDAGGYSQQQKQQIAAKVGLSETAFIGPSAIADFKFDFFTPTRQIAHCGHATIASFWFLKQTGKISSDESSKETIDGTRKIFFHGEKAFMEQTAPKFTEVTEEDRLLTLTSLGLGQQPVNWPPVIVNTGNSFLILEVADEEALRELTPDFAIISALSEKYGLVGFYIFCRTSSPEPDATARMFGPAYGIEEESATGMAAGPLACYLHRFIIKKSMYRIEQGRFMRPASASLIDVRLVLEDGRISSLYAGGTALVTRELVLDID